MVVVVVECSMKAGWGVCHATSSCGLLGLVEEMEWWCYLSTALGDFDFAKTTANVVRKYTAHRPWRKKKKKQSQRTGSTNDNSTSGSSSNGGKGSGGEVLGRVRAWHSTRTKGTFLHFEGLCCNKRGY